MIIHVPRFSRRRFLRSVGHGALLASLPSALWADNDNLVTISILHTTDLHGHILPTVDYKDNPDLGGLARCATQIRDWRKANPHSLLIDIGDVYQGTEVGLETRGAIMIRCLNGLAYDAWVVGNHEFDWGLEVLSECVGFSSMPVLSGNAIIDGKPVGMLGPSSGPLAKLRPYLIKEIAGFRLAIISLTTPALSTWLPPEKLRGFEVLDPIEALHGLLREVSPLQPDAIILAGHMGLTRRDDNANRVGALTQEFPQLTAYIGGHTHQNHSSEIVNNVLYTQADHFGIYAGKVALTFDRNSRQLVHREACTVPMDHQIAFDPLVMNLAHADLDMAAQTLAQKIGELTDVFNVVSTFGRPSDVERLIASAMIVALRKKGVKVDAVVHGLFDEKHPLQPGVKTVADMWTLLPYENEIVTIEVTYEELLALAHEFSSGREPRNFMGFRVLGSINEKTFRVDSLRAADGSVLSTTLPYYLALNSYDSQSGGQRFLTLAKLVMSPSSRRSFHPIQIRDALIDFFLDRGKVNRSSLIV